MEFHMGGFFGAISSNDCIQDVFYGTDYHSHLGTRRGGMTSYSPDLGFQRNIHSIENSPFRKDSNPRFRYKRGLLCKMCRWSIILSVLFLKWMLRTYAKVPILLYQLQKLPKRMAEATKLQEASLFLRVWDGWNKFPPASLWLICTSDFVHCDDFIIYCLLLLDTYKVF